MYQTAREFFDATREAVRDAYRLGRMLDELDAQAGPFGRGISFTSVSGTHSDRVAQLVARRVERVEEVEQRLESDLRYVDVACEILYGKDGISDGLFALVGWPADAIYHRYIGLRTWEAVAVLMGFNVSYVYENVGAAFDLMDACGMTATIAGRGLAEG